MSPPPTSFMVMLSKALAVILFVTHHAFSREARRQRGEKSTGVNPETQDEASDALQKAFVNCRMLDDASLPKTSGSRGNSKIGRVVIPLEGGGRKGRRQMAS